MNRRIFFEWKVFWLQMWLDICATVQQTFPILLILRV